MLKMKWLFVAIATLFLLIACRPPEQVSLSCNLPTLNRSEPSKAAATIKLFVDATPSMKGFVATGSDTRYTKLLDLLDSTFQLGGSSVEYYRFGTKTQKITRDRYREARKPEFYTEPVSQVEVAISEPTSPNQLTVIVTDLYQRDEDIVKVTKPIQQYYLNSDRYDQGYAVGILAIRSEFEGLIYQEDGSNKNFPYSTQRKSPDRFRPFYVILLGRHDNITRYVEQMTTNGKDILTANASTPVSHVTLFSPGRLLSEPSSLSANVVTAELQDGLQEPASLNDGKVVIETSDQPIKLLEIVDAKRENLSVNYQVPLKVTEYTLGINPNSIQTNIDVQAFDPAEKKFIAVQDESLKKALTVSLGSVKSDASSMHVKARIQPQSLQNPGVYFFKVDAIAQELQADQPWWQEWSSTNQTSTDGSKTYNLLGFLRQLRTLTGDGVANPQARRFVGRFCYAIQKN